MTRPFNGGKNTLFNKCCWDNWIATCKRINLDPYLIPYTKINSNEIKDLNVRNKTIKLLQDDTGANHHEFRFGDGFLAMAPKAQSTKEKSRLMGLH